MFDTDFLQHEQCKPNQIVTTSSEQNKSTEYSGWKSYASHATRFMQTLFMAGLIFTVPGSDAKPSRKLNSASNASEIDGPNCPLLNNLPSGTVLPWSTTTELQISSAYTDNAQNNTQWWNMVGDNHKIYQSETSEISEISETKLKCSPNSSEDEQDRLKSYLKDMIAWLDSREEEEKACSPHDEGRCKYKKLSLLKNAFCNKEKQKELKYQLESIPDTRNMMPLDAYNALLKLVVPELTDSLLDKIRDSCEHNQKIYAENNQLLNYLSQLLNANIKKFIQLIKESELTSQIETPELESQLYFLMLIAIKQAITGGNADSLKVCKRKVEEIWKKDLPFIVVETIEDMHLSLEVLEKHDLLSNDLQEYFENRSQLTEILNKWTDGNTAKPNDKIIHQQISKKIEEHQRKYKKTSTSEDFQSYGEIDAMMFARNLNKNNIEYCFSRIKEYMDILLANYITEVTSGEKRKELFLLAEDAIQHKKTIKYLLEIQKKLLEVLPYTPTKLQSTDPCFFPDIDINADIHKISQSMETIVVDALYKPLIILMSLMFLIHLKLEIKSIWNEFKLT